MKWFLSGVALGVGAALLLRRAPAEEPVQEEVWDEAFIFGHPDTLMEVPPGAVRPYLSEVTDPYGASRLYTSADEGIKNHVIAPPKSALARSHCGRRARVTFE